LLYTRIPLSCCKINFLASAHKNNCWEYVSKRIYQKNGTTNYPIEARGKGYVKENAPPTGRALKQIKHLSKQKLPNAL